MKLKLIFAAILFYSAIGLGQNISLECKLNELIDQRVNCANCGADDELFSGLLITENGRITKIYSPFKVKFKSTRLVNILDAYGNTKDLNVRGIKDYNTKNLLVNFLEACYPGSTGGGLLPDGDYGNVSVFSDGTEIIINDDVIIGSYIADGNIFNVDLAPNAVTSDKILNETITASDIANDAITSDELDETGVTPGAYTNADITVDADGRITEAANGSGGASSNFKGVHEAIDSANANGVSNTEGDYVFIYTASGFTYTEGQVFTIYQDPDTDGTTLDAGSPAEMYDNTTNGIAGTENNDYFGVTTDGAVTFSLYRNISNSPVGPLGGVGTVKAAYDATVDGRLAVPQTGLTQGFYKVATYHDNTYKFGITIDSTITAEKLTTGAVTSAKILDGTILGEDINDDAITASKVGAGEIGASEIASTAVVAGAYTNADITIDEDGRVIDAANGSSGGVSDGDKGDITVSGTGTVFSIDADAVTTTKIINSAVTESKIQDLSVTTSKIGTDAVTNSKLSDSAVDNDKLATSSVTSSKIQDGSIAGVDIASSAITSDLILNNTITTSDIENGTIGNVDLALNSIESDNILNATILPEDLANTAVSAGSYTNANFTVNAQGQITDASNGQGAQTLSISNDTLFISDGNDVKLPDLTSTISVTSTSGWASYTDTVYTVGSPLSVTVGGGQIDLPNGAHDIVDSELPSDIDSLYNGTIIEGLNGDAYQITIEFKVKPDGPSADPRVQVSIDIGGSIGELYPRDFNLTKGDGNEHYYLSSFLYYSLDTWESNGGTVKLTAINEDVLIYDIRYVIARTHKSGNEFIQSNSMTSDHYKAIIGSNTAADTNVFMTENDIELSISNDTLSISGGNFVVLPESGGGGGSSKVLKTVASDITYANGQVTQDIAGLTGFVVTSGTTYRFSGLINATSTLNASFGIRFGLEEVSGADGTWTGHFTGSTNETGANERYTITSTALEHTTSAVLNTSSVHVFEIEAIFICTSSGTIDIQCGSEASNAGRIVRAGSSVSMEEY